MQLIMIKYLNRFTALQFNSLMAHFDCSYTKTLKTESTMHEHRFDLKSWSTCVPLNGLQALPHATSSDKDKQKADVGGKSEGMRRGQRSAVTTRSNIPFCCCTSVPVVTLTCTKASEMVYAS